MSAGAGGPRVSDLFDRAEGRSLAHIILQGFGAVFFGIGTAIASGILTVADVLIIPLGALADGGANLVSTIFGGASLIIDFGALSTALSIGPDGAFNVGPFTLALAVGAVLLALYVVNAYVSEDSTGNFVPGIPFDIPTPGFLGPEEEEE
jgi:hypothetical protein